MNFKFDKKFYVDINRQLHGLEKDVLKLLLIKHMHKKLRRMLKQGGWGKKILA